MFEKITENLHSVLFNDILESRRTVRRFSAVTPEKSQIAEIIEAGRLSPFLSVDGIVDDDFKKFIIISGGTQAAKELSNIIKDGIQDYVLTLEKHDKDSTWLPHLRKCAKQGSPDITTAPYTIIVAEKAGLKPFTSKSISHCLQNMWLKAASLKLGFQLMSELYVLGNYEKFCKAIGINCCEYELDGCIVGIPSTVYKPAKVNYPPKNDCEIWI